MLQTVMRTLALWDLALLMAVPLSPGKKTEKKLHRLSKANLTELTY